MDQIFKGIWENVVGVEESVRIFQGYGKACDLNRERERLWNVLKV